MNILLVLGILVFLIVVHELGHFVVAKLCKVKVEEFGVGYPPKAFSLGTWGGTEYTLNWIPFGGFVRLYGEESRKQHGPGALQDAPRYKQALIMIAGVAMNVITACGVFAYAYMHGVPHAVTEPGSHTSLIVTEVVPGGPAAVAGVQAGDTLLEVQTTRREKPESMTPEQVTAFVRANAGQPLLFTYVHKNATTTAQITPAHAVLERTRGEAAVGIGLVLVTSQPMPWNEALAKGLKRTWYEAISIVSHLRQMVTKVTQGENGLANVVGPVGLVSIVGDASTHGFGYLLGLIGVISVNLAIINLIPIPALDGGRLVVLGIESIIRRPSPPGVVALLNALGVLLMIALMITVTYQDIARLLA